MPSGRRVQSGSLRFSRAYLGVIWIIQCHVSSRERALGVIRVCVGSLVRSSKSSGSFGLVYVHSGALEDLGFIRDGVCSLKRTFGWSGSFAFA